MMIGSLLADYQWLPWVRSRAAGFSLVNDASFLSPNRFEAEAAVSGKRRRLWLHADPDFFSSDPGLFSPRLRTYGMIRRTENLTWIIPTEQPENCLSLSSCTRCDRFMTTPGVSNPSWSDACMCKEGKRGFRSNVWIAAKVGTQAEANARIPNLKRVGCKKKIVCVYGATERVSLESHLTDGYCFSCCAPCFIRFGACSCCGSDEVRSKIRWVVFGSSGRSGSEGTYASDCERARGLKTECARARVPFFVASLGMTTDPISLDACGLTLNRWPIDLIGCREILI